MELSELDKLRLSNVHLRIVAEKRLEQLVSIYGGLEGLRDFLNQSWGIDWCRVELQQKRAIELVKALQVECD